MNEPNTTAVKKKNKFAEVWKRLCKNTGAVIGMIIILIFVLGAVFANLIRPYDLVIRQEAAIRLDPPSAEHWFGTDNLGRDTFTRMVYGARVSLSISFAGVMSGCLVGVLLGVCAGFFGGWVDTLVSRLIDILLAFPSLLLAITVVAILGSGTENTAIAIAIFSIPSIARMVRGIVMSNKDA